MTPVVSTQPKDEPTIEVTIHTQKHQFMVDTGATYSCIRSEGSSVKIVGFSEKNPNNTQPVPMLIG